MCNLTLAVSLMFYKSFGNKAQLDSFIPRKSLKPNVIVIINVLPLLNADFMIKTLH